MSLSHLWPSFAADRILYEDDDLIVIDKPIHVSTHAPDAGRNDDAVSRLKLALSERDRIPEAQIYIGIHQRLDRDTSGALLFTRRKTANPGIAEQFEKRTVQKTYVAIAVGWPKGKDEGVLTNLLAPAKDGRMQVVSASPRARVQGAQKAVTRFRVTRREADRALVELSPETGRTHQLRVQVAAMGAPIAGDRMYDGAAAPRLMLHAARIDLRHPTTGEPLEVSAPLPADILDWFENPNRAVFDDGTLVDARIREALGSRWALGASDETTAFRIVHREGDGLPGVAIDVYGEHLVVHFFSDEALAHKETILDHAFSLGVQGIYQKVHPKQSNTLVDTRKDSLAPSAPVRGEPAPDPLVIREAGLSYRVRLGDGLKTGIFLDQRENRRRIREMSRDKSVLNLFAYTCAFTVAAAAGGARSTVSVDASKGVLAWGRENMEENGLGAASHLMVDVDAMAWLELAAKRRERYDIVVLDPPSFATTKTSTFSAADDYAELAAQALAVLAPGGRLLACTNHRGITLLKFRKRLHEAGRLAGRAVVQVKDLPAPTDFPAAIGSDPDLKSLLVTVE